MSLFTKLLCKRMKMYIYIYIYWHIIPPHRSGTNSSNHSCYDAMTCLSASIMVLISLSHVICYYLGLYCTQAACHFYTMVFSYYGDIFKRIFLNENIKISIKVTLKFVPKGPINKSPSLVPIMAWRRPGDKPLSEPMMISLLTHICVTRLQLVLNLLGEMADKHLPIYQLISWNLANNIWNH